MENRTLKATLVLLIIITFMAVTAAIHRHHNPSLREVFESCEKGTTKGQLCCEDLFAADCAPITPEHPDPLGQRLQLEQAWDMQKGNKP